MTESVQVATPLDAALAYAAGGLSVVPWRLDKKGSALVGGVWKDKATTDEATIRRWGRVWAKSLIACVVPAGRVVMDVDYPDRLDGQALPMSPTRVGGRGQQIWLAGAAPYMTKLPNDAGELLGAGHIAILPTPGSTYAWLDDRRPWDSDLSPVPGWATAVRKAERESVQDGDAPPPMTSRNEILGLAGRLAEVGGGYEARLTELLARYGDGRIDESDASRPWTKQDFEAIAKNPKSVADFRVGNEGAINFLKGQVMKLSKGKANPQLVGEILQRKLKDG